LSEQRPCLKHCPLQIRALNFTISTDDILGAYASWCLALRSLTSHGLPLAMRATVASDLQLTIVAQRPKHE
jgi:hypothetical protein